MTAHADYRALVDYWMGELELAREEALEEHFFACASCTARLEELAALGGGIRAAFRAGTVRAGVSSAFVERLKREGLKVREYRVPPGGSVQCTMGPGDDFVVSRYAAALADVERVDVLQRVEAGGKVLSEARLDDVPFDAAAGEVLLVPSPAIVRKLPKNTLTVRLLAVGADGERMLGEYKLEHTPG
jgi:hypothetical protein